MTSNEYTQALEKALADLESRIQERDFLNAKIAGDRETVRVLASRISLSKERREFVGRLLDLVDYATPTLANSIRTVLAKAYPRAMTAVEVRNELEDLKFNFDDFSNSLAACHAALKRMATEDEVLPEERKDGKTTYRRILKLTPPPPAPPIRLSVAELIRRTAKTQAQKEKPTLDALSDLGIIGKIRDIK